MVSPHQLLQHLGTLADTPDAVPKLRALILDLAIRGALVPQNLHDLPACKLVELAKVQTKEQRKPQRASNGNGPTRPTSFPLPQGWCWTSLDDLGDTAPRNELPDGTEVGFSPMRLVAAKFGDPISFERRTWADVRKGFTHFADGDVVLAKITPCFENGKSGVIRAAPNGFGAGTTELHVFRPVPNCVLPEYVLIFLKSPHFLLNGEAHMTGSAGQKRVPWTYFARTAFPLPPLPEQGRIVAKVEELLTMCDELEARQSTAREHHTRLVHSALDHLTSAKDETDFRKQCSFILQNSSLILDSVPAIRQAILSLAVQGKLVSQDPHDQPASVLLSQILANNPQLHHSFRESSEQVGALDDLAHIPKSWAAVALGRVMKITSSKRIFESEYSESGVPFFRSKEIGDLSRGEDIKTTLYISTERYLALKQHADFPKPGDLLLTSVGTIGNTWIVDGREFYFKDGNITQIIRTDGIEMGYVQLYISSPLFTDAVERIVAGTAYNALTIVKIKSMMFPLPPLAEQHRIVAKVDELMRWCDELESRLTVAQTTATHLLDAALDRALRGEL